VYTSYTRATNSTAPTCVNNRASSDCFSITASLKKVASGRVSKFPRLIKTRLPFDCLEIVIESNHCEIRKPKTALGLHSTWFEWNRFPNAREVYILQVHLRRYKLNVPYSHGPSSKNSQRLKVLQYSRCTLCNTFLRSRLTYYANNFRIRYCLVVTQGNSTLTQKKNKKK